MGYSHAVLNPTFSEKCKLYILKWQSQAGRVAPDLCRAPTSVVGCPPGQKRNSDVKGSRHTLLVPLGSPRTTHYMCSLSFGRIKIRPPLPGSGRTPRFPTGPGHGEGYKSPFEALGSLLAFFCSQNPIKSKKSLGCGADNISK